MAKPEQQHSETDFSPMLDGLHDARSALQDLVKRHLRLPQGAERRALVEFLDAFRSYRNDSRDQRALWEWIRGQAGRELDPYFRTRIVRGLHDLGDMTPGEALAAVRESAAMSPKRLREQAIDELRQGFRVYAKHAAAIWQHGGEREAAVRDLLASSIAARGGGTSTR